MSDYILRSYNYDKRIRQKSKDNTVNQFPESTVKYKQNVRKNYELQPHEGSQAVASESDNVSYFGELEDILSKEIQILNNAGFNALQGKRNYRRFQPPSDEAWLKHEADNANVNPDMMTSVLPYEGIEIQCPCNTRNSNNTAMNCVKSIFPSNFQQTQTVPPCAATLKINGNDSLQTQVIESARQRYNKFLQRKAAHNKIEKRRRSFINDKIKELYTLLPKHLNSQSCASKGSILQKSVDYIKILQYDLEQIRQLQDKIFDIERDSKHLAARVEILEGQTLQEIDSVLHEPLQKEFPNLSQAMNLDEVSDIFA